MALYKFLVIHSFFSFIHLCFFDIAYFERLNEGPQQDADGVALAQQFYQTRGAKQSQKSETNEAVLKHQQSLTALDTMKPTILGSFSNYGGGPKTRQPLTDLSLNLSKKNL